MPLILEVTPKQARSGERIDFSGDYRGARSHPPGAALRVGLHGFPGHRHGAGRSYRTDTHRAGGQERFRALDKSADLASNVVTITIS